MYLFINIRKKNSLIRFNLKILHYPKNYFNRCTNLYIHVDGGES